jgi:hypothetical protein
MDKAITVEIGIKTPISVFFECFHQIINGILNDQPIFNIKFADLIYYFPFFRFIGNVSSKNWVIKENTFRTGSKKLSENSNVLR